MRLFSEAFFSLPAETRVALVLRLMEGDGIEGVAIALGIGRAGARKLFAEGVRSLRRRMAQLGYEPPDEEAIGRLLRAMPVPDLPPGFRTRLRRLGLA